MWAYMFCSVVLLELFYFVQACDVLKGFLPELSPEDMADKMVVITSDFKRTRETAEIVHENLKVKMPLRMDIRLRERGMGDLDKQPPNVFYETLLRDEVDPTHTDNNVESVGSMVIRMTHVVNDVEKEFKDKVVVLVSHGDPLLTLYAVSQGESPSVRVKKFSPFKNCDTREIECLQ